MTHLADRLIERGLAAAEADIHGIATIAAEEPPKNNSAAPAQVGAAKTLKSNAHGPVKMPGCVI